MFILEAILIASSCSIDAFAASFAYGTKRIKIPWPSNLVITFIGSIFLGLSLWAGSAIRGFLPKDAAIWMAFTILCLIGLTKFLDGITKDFIRRYIDRHGRHPYKWLKFSFFNFRFILSVVANPEEADINQNRNLSPGEAATLAVSLSLDGLAVGFGAALGNANALYVVPVSLLAGTLAVCSGCLIGNKLADKLPFPISWLSGAILIGLGISKLF
ncbi:MAG: manganese efflux pump [Lachnospiraceae bacterium]|nr:manganese efflux pump [Lachnospiraceae bacterium]